MLSKWQKKRKKSYWMCEKVWKHSSVLATRFFCGICWYNPKDFDERTNVYVETDDLWLRKVLFTACVACFPLLGQILWPPNNNPLVACLPACLHVFLVVASLWCINRMWRHCGAIIRSGGPNARCSCLTAFQLIITRLKCMKVNN